MSLAFKGNVKQCTVSAITNQTQSYRNSDLSTPGNRENVISFCGSKIEWIYLVFQICDWKLIVSAQFFPYKLKLLFLRNAFAKWWPTLLLSCSTMASQKRCAQYQQKTFLDKVHPSERQAHRVQRLERCRLISGAPAIVSRRYWARWARFASFVEDGRQSKLSILINAIITHHHYHHVSEH